MKFGFNTILIPVDFTVNSTVAIRKALSLCNGTNISIHLLHNALSLSFSFSGICRYLTKNSLYGNPPDIQGSKERLGKYRNYILGVQPGVEVTTSVTLQNSIEEAIIDKSKKIGANLIVLGKNSHHSWLPFLNTVVPATIAKRTGIPVLTIKPGANDVAIRTVVVPIGDRFPHNKVAVINELRRRFRFQTRLITFRKGHDGSVVVPGSLLNAYRILKNNPGSQVSYEILSGNNRAKAIMAYCEKVNADLLIVNPDNEMKVGWMNKQMPDVLPVNSKTQILAVLQPNL